MVKHRVKYCEGCKSPLRTKKCDGCPYFCPSCGRRGINGKIRTLLKCEKCGKTVKVLGDEIKKTAYRIFPRIVYKGKGLLSINGRTHKLKTLYFLRTIDRVEGKDGIPHSSLVLKSFSGKFIKKRPKIQMVFPDPYLLYKKRKIGIAQMKLEMMEVEHEVATTGKKRYYRRK